MAERTKALAWKVRAGNTAAGSNPVTSASCVKKCGTTPHHKHRPVAYKLVKANRTLEIWQSGLLHHPAKVKSLELGAVGSNPTISALGCSLISKSGSILDKNQSNG